ncbi:MAG TPA: PHP domain-containing protein [Thermoanaerobaculia bacterium]|jgi:DNA polymerase (family 10)|nr:PHP domain-containing protein [Thermoanaerobaculia bacterium]
MNKFDIARALDEISTYVELSENNRFRALAFERAAQSIRAIDAEPADLIASGELIKLEGIGKGTAAVIDELVRTGQSKYLEDLRKLYPPGILELLRVPKLGLKKIGILHQKLGIGSLDDLEEAARAGRLASLPGFGTKTEQFILGSIGKARHRESHFLLPVGVEVGEQIREHLAAIEEIDDAEVSGSVRRRLEVIRNVNIVIATRAQERVVEALAGFLERIERIDDDTVKAFARNEIAVWFHFTKPEAFGATLLATTGTPEFVGAFLAHGGKLRRARTEKELFDKAGLAYVDPERRENGDDLKHKRHRRLIEVSDLRGTFHVHTTFSDGRNTVHEMLSAAHERGFEYVGISDHSPAAFYAGGLSVEKLRLQQKEIAANERGVAPMRVFRGTEADILPDGSIDYDATTLEKFDFVIASIHSRFQMTKDEMTERMLRALDNPCVTFLGHLTGRKLLSRDGYTIDYERIFEKASARGVMIEINGNPNRLDIDWRHVRRALDLGVGFAINPDAHSVHEYAALISGTWVARKAGLSAKEIFNTKPVEEVSEYLKGRRKGLPRG